MMVQTRESRKLALAILISLLLHFVVGYSLAALGGAFTPPLPMEDHPVELTIVDSAAMPSPPVDPPYLETAPSRESVEKPKEQTFESNVNSIAASQLPATGDVPLPTQDGKDRPFVHLDTHQYSLPTEGSKAVPEAQPTVPPEIKRKAELALSKPAATAEPAAIPAATAEPERLAMLTSTPPPPIRDPDETESTPPPVTAEPVTAPARRPKPELAASTYRAEKEQTRIRGSLTNRGPSSVNAVGTPLGRYRKAVSDAIGSRWYYYIKSKMDLASIGTAQIRAEVDAQGHLQNLEVVSNNANEAFANICLQSFQEARIPPIPPDLINTLPNGRMPVDFSFTVYPNQW